MRTDGLLVKGVRIEADSNFPLPIPFITEFSMKVNVRVKSVANWDRNTIREVTASYIALAQGNASYKPYLEKWLKLIKGRILEDKTTKWNHTDEDGNLVSDTISDFEFTREEIRQDAFAFRKHGWLVIGVIPYDFMKCVWPTRGRFGEVRVLQGIWMPSPLKLRATRPDKKEWMAKKLAEYSGRGTQATEGEVRELKSAWRRKPKLKFVALQFLPYRVQGESVATEAVVEELVTIHEGTSAGMRQLRAAVSENPILRGSNEALLKVNEQTRRTTRKQTAELYEGRVRMEVMSRGSQMRSRPTYQATPVPPYYQIREGPQKEAPKPTVVATIKNNLPTFFVLVAGAALSLALIASGLLIPVTEKSTVDIINARNNNLAWGAIILLVTLVVFFLSRRRIAKQELAESEAGQPAPQPQSQAGPPKA